MENIRNSPFEEIIVGAPIAAPISDQYDGHLNTDEYRSLKMKQKIVSIIVSNAAEVSQPLIHQNAFKRVAWAGPRGNLPDCRKHSSSFRTALALFPPKSRPMAKADERSLIKNQQKRGSSRLEPKEIVHIKVPMANRPRAGTKEMTGPVVITSRGINERAPDNDINCLQEFKKMMTKEGFHICKGTLDTGQTQSRISFRRRRQRMLKIDLDQGILFWNSFDPKKINTDLNKIPLTSIIEIAQGPFPSSRIPEREGRCHVGIKSLDPKIEIVFQGASMEKTDFFVDGLALLCAEEKKSRTSFTSEMKSAI